MIAVVDDRAAGLLASDVAPDFRAVGGTEFSEVVGALLTYGLLTSVVMLVACAAGWALGAAAGDWQSTTRARAGVLVALGGAVLTGGALAWTGWLIDLGSRL
ncbi:hypothetical protein GCM10028784_30120 [Myceligenerans cantabricum]